jgi:oxygen-dependent protoporphyrinogen oxidase
MPPKHIVIIGGGISGLTAAWRLQQSGLIDTGTISVTLLEASQRLGGKMQSQRINNEYGSFVVESGPDAMLTTKPWAKQLSIELGLESQHIGTNQIHKTLYVWYRNALHTMPAGMYLVAPTRIMPVLRSTLLSWRGKLSLLWERFRPAKHDPQDESLVDFLTRRFGREVAETIGIPLMAGIYNADPQRQSMESTFPQMRTQERTHGSITRATITQLRANRTSRSGGIFFSLPGGVQQLVDTLAQRLDRIDVRLNTQVAHVRHDGTRYQIQTTETTFDADYVILATPARISAQILEAHHSALSQLLAEQRYVSTGTISLAYPAHALTPDPDGFGVLYATTSKKQFNAITISSIKFAHRAPEGYHLFRLFFGGQNQAHLIEAGDDELTTLATQELTQVLAVSGKPLFARISRYPNANPQYDVGHQQWLHRIEQTLPPHLYVTGSSYRGIGIPDCINDANRTAHALITHIQGAST